MHTQLASAATAAHSLALELYRFTAQWPECERDGLTLEVRRAGRALSGGLDAARAEVRNGALRRAVGHARRKHATLRYLLRLATDLGYRKLSSSSRADDLMDDLEMDLNALTWQARAAGDFIDPGVGVASVLCGRADRNSGKAVRTSHHPVSKSHYR